MFIVQDHWFMDTYISRFSLIIYYDSAVLDSYQQKQADKWLWVLHLY